MHGSCENCHRVSDPPLDLASGFHLPLCLALPSSVAWSLPHFSFLLRLGPLSRLDLGYGRINGIIEVRWVCRSAVAIELRMFRKSSGGGGEQVGESVRVSPGFGMDALCKALVISGLRSISTPNAVILLVRFQNAEARTNTPPTVAKVPMRASEGEPGSTVESTSVLKPAGAFGVLTWVVTWW